MRAIDIRSATIADAVSLAPRMRTADRDEVRAALGLSPLAGLMMSLRGAQEAYAGTLDGEVIALFGVSDARPWLLGSDDVAGIPMAFLRRSRIVVNTWCERYGRIENRADARNTMSLKWLGWLGFTIEDPEPWGYERRPFCLFWKEPHNVHGH